MKLELLWSVVLERAAAMALKETTESEVCCTEGWAVDEGRILARHFMAAPLRAVTLGHTGRGEREKTRRQTCSDFRESSAFDVDGL